MQQLKLVNLHTGRAVRAVRHYGRLYVLYTTTKGKPALAPIGKRQLASYAAMGKRV